MIDAGRRHAETIKVPSNLAVVDAVATVATGEVETFRNIVPKEIEAGAK